MIHPRRKFRITGFILLVSVFAGICVLLITVILSDARRVVAYGQYENNLASVHTIHRYLTAIATPRHNPMLEPILDSFYSDSTFHQNFTTVPVLPTPYYSFLSLFAGYRVDGKIVKLMMAQPSPNFSSILLEQALDLKGKGYSDSLWEIKSKTFSSGDTVYFHAHAIDKIAYHKLLPFLMDDALDKIPSRYMVNTMASGKIAKDTLKNDLITVWLQYKLRTIYRRGPTGDRFIAYEQDNFAGDPEMKIHYFYYRTIEYPAHYRKDLEKRLSELMWAVIMLLMTILMAGLTRGHSVFPTRKKFEMNWEYSKSAHDENN